MSDVKMSDGNHALCVIDDCWKEFERVGELSNSNADNILAVVSKLQGDNELLRGHMIKIHEISGDIQVHHFASRALAATAKG